jgi:chromodomain-helicase-DNA-binding protein 7
MSREVNRKKVQYVDTDDDEWDAQFLVKPEEGKVEQEDVVADDGMYTTLIIEKVLGRKNIPVELEEGIEDGELGSEYKTKGQNGILYEEMFFIKWRKLSYLHASWERREDLERVDPQARTKIKKFMLAPQLPGILGEKIHKTKSSNGDDDEEAEEEEEEIDAEQLEYYNPDCSEVHRIISCDYKKVWHKKVLSPLDLLSETIPNYISNPDLLNNINISSLNKNGKVESTAMELEEGEEIEPVVKKSKESDKYDEDFDDEMNADSDDDVDIVEEDNSGDVKYLVKWRGLPYSECTWESWSETKSFTYIEVFNFWRRQKAPPLQQFSIKHPTIQEYVKIDKSPQYGESKDDHFTKDADDKIAEEDKYPGLFMRDYQVEGVNWLLWNWWHGRSCVLADEMGLGKTIQTICFLHELQNRDTTQVCGPFIIVAPLSLIAQWQSELEIWSPDMNCIVLHGNQEAREMIVEHEFFYKETFTNKEDCKSLRKANACKFHILLTTFEMAAKDISILRKIKWQVLIVDEAHRLKNKESRLFEQLTQLPREHCVLLTGTPLQNKTEELWALLNFADKEKFENQEFFLGQFGDLKNADQVAKLHDVLKPYLLRRVKEDVEKSLPPKEETIVEVALTSTQKQFYKAIYEKNTVFLFKGTKSSNQPSLMNVMMELRKCCNHPYLIKGVEDRIVSETPQEDRPVDFYTQKMIESSGKLVLLDKLLPRLFQQGHKVLIFSQMVRVLNILEDFLRARGYVYERLDGSSRASDRNDAVDRFKKPSLKRFVMLLSTKAGGLGLNLTVADTVIIYDSDWNPQNDLQAQARAHRIGQTRAVMVYRLLTRKTYEMHMFHQASLKLGLDRAVLAHARNDQKEEVGRKSSKDSSKPNFNSKEIDELLKRGAYDVFREDDSEQVDFIESDIDSILQRRSHKISYDDAAKPAAALGSFSKASFVSDDGNEDIDINDPDFWKKAIGLEEAEVSPDEICFGENYDMISNLPLQRIRKQTINYTSENQSYTNKEIKQLFQRKREIRVPNQPKPARVARKVIQDKEPKLKMALDAIAKAQMPPSLWGAHTRDRVLRALNLYGIGRWEKIKYESGGTSKGIEDVIFFSTAYLMQCLIITKDRDGIGSTSYSKFIRNSVNLINNKPSKKNEKEFNNSGANTIANIPPALLDSKYTVKLESGLAKKSLQKLDLLSRLQDIITIAIDAAVKAKGGKLKYDVDITITSNIQNAEEVEYWFDKLTVDEICEHLPISDSRPSWAKLQPWWDRVCDLHLLIGIYRCGYGRYELLRDDKSLIFGKRLDAYALENDLLIKTETNENDMNIDNVGNSTESNGESVVNESEIKDNKMDLDQNIQVEFDMKEVDFKNNKMEDNQDGYDSVNVSPMMNKTNNNRNNSNNDIEDGEINDDSEMKDDDDDDDEDTNVLFTNSSSLNNNVTTQMNTTNIVTLGLPDARTINRLFSWLITSDNARTYSINTTDSVKRNATSRNINNSYDLNDLTEEDVMEGIQEIDIDTEAMSLLYKSGSAILKRCESIIKVAPVVTDGINVTFDNVDFDNEVDLPSEIKSGTDKKKLSIDETNRLCCAFITHGAPLATGEEFISSKILESIGIYSSPTEIIAEPSESEIISQIASSTVDKDVIMETNDVELKDCKASISNVNQYTWLDLQQNFCEWLSIDEIKKFYDFVFLPFCHKISRKNSGFNGSIRKTIPDPYRRVSDHHISTKGLCLLFLQRQQLLHAARYVLIHELDKLINYLKSKTEINNPIYNLDNLPIWWCPWIHDVAILIGYVKHGYLNLEKIISDSDLAFSDEHLTLHIKRSFLYGNRNMKPSAIFEIKSIESAEAWVNVAKMMFPDSRDVENRIIKILEDMTLHLPKGHSCKVRTFSNYNSLVKVDDVENKSHNKKNIKQSVSLEGYLKESVKRRYDDISKRHPNFAQSK